MSEQEKYYDEQIAPQLLAIAKECQAHGLSLVAACDYGNNELAEISTIAPDGNFGVRMVKAAVQANGNVDALMLALLRHANKHGHRSAVLKQLGAAEDPPKDGLSTGP